MAPIREWLRRVWRRGQRSDQDLDAELQLHLELLAEEKRRLPVRQPEHQSKSRVTSSFITSLTVVDRRRRLPESLLVAT